MSHGGRLVPSKMEESFTYNFQLYGWMNTAYGYGKFFPHPQKWP